ncbi:undecaprenyl diphosphate synthase [Caldanaerobius fijiensis DSM 17918]|uniref:Isoprenyl transferase n=2 Tax=Caldanaerobius TaxID=862261 RepID=A0A1M4XJ86_9THEO|nr:isoprenyl transferase [Caldanaerobius fijiensis]SHE93470.1 undecaprenyl diphosphate synthase [Caldanaerobius fijiensis DSM 17918]
MDEMMGIDKSKLPKHIAIIMDGNGRWAQKRGMPRTAGHRAGIKTVKKVIEFCSQLGIEYLTLYAFSTENWKRPEKEVNALFKLLVYYLRREIDELDENNVRLNFIGDISSFDKDIRSEIDRAKTALADNDGLIVNLALNYGGRAEILNAVRGIVRDMKKLNITADEIDEALFSKYIYTAGMPDPDLLIRTGGEYRVSNFLLWQIAYSELWYTDVLWPDFSEKDLLSAIANYQDRNRRFGGL